jgi:ABC-type glycerol-3-phosphate transport system substrate-binding protein
MMGKRRQLRLVGLALALALVAAACGGGGDEGGDDGDQQAATAQKGGVLRMATTDFGYTNGFDVTGEYLGSAFTIYTALVRTLVS